MPKVTVILPCLNMITYIRQCMDSVISQTLSDIEILVIDAGSTDGTRQVLELYKENDPRIQIIDSDKKSYGYQVNKGIGIACGEYIGIVDTDDRIAPHMYETLYRIAHDTGVDYVKGTARGFFSISDSLTYYFRIAQFEREEYLNGQIAVVPKKMPELLTKDNFLWYGIYRNDFLKKVRLHESSGAAFQDLGGLLQTLLNSKHAIYVPDSLYEYRQDNVNSSGFNKKGFHFVADEYAFAASFLPKGSEKWCKSFYRKMFLHIMDRFQAMASTGEFWAEAETDMKELSSRIQKAVKNNIIVKQDFRTEDWESLEIFIKDPKLLYQNCFSEYCNKKRSLEQTIKQISGKRVVIFGNGRMGTFLHVQLLRHGSNNVMAYCDNQAKDHEDFMYGIPVLAPDEAVKIYKGAFFVIANRHHADVMKCQLMSLGINEKNILSYTAGIDTRLFGEKLD